MLRPYPLGTFKSRVLIQILSAPVYHNYDELFHKFIILLVSAVYE